MRNYIVLTSVAVSSLACGVAMAAPCNEQIAVSSPTSRFIVSEDIAIDVQSDLVWRGCPLGYDHDDNGTVSEPLDDQCILSDTANYDWAGALQAAEAENAAAGPGEPNDWRIPNIKELLSIVKRQCVNPAINASIFPQPANTFIGLVWSATYSGDVVSGPRAYAMDFGSGSPSLRSRDTDGGLFAVLLVRDAL